MKSSILNDWVCLSSEIGNSVAAKRAAILSFPNPLLNALCVKDVLFVAVECRHEVIAQEIAPADRALAPKTGLTVVYATILLLKLSCFGLILRLLQRRDNFRHRKWDGK